MSPARPADTAPPRKAILTHTEDGIRWVVIENPARLNALTAAMWQGVTQAIRDAERDPAVRVVVIRGAGTKAFSAGADISEFDTARTGDQAKVYDQLNDEAYQVLMRSKKPTIAMIHGYCFGGALELAACCDMRLGDEVSTYSVPAAKLGLGYNPRWIRPMLASLTPARTKEMLYTGRRYTATEAVQIGFLNRMLPTERLEAETRALAGEIAANAPLSIYAAKVAVDEFLYAPGDVDMAKLDRLVEACFASADYAEGRAAFMEKRKPAFKGR